MPTPPPPNASVSRLVTYLRIVTDKHARGVKQTSSKELAEAAQVSAFQVRKDLAYLGTFGTRGTGYSVELLERELRKGLGLDRIWNVAIVGMGRLGQALADFPHIKEYGFRLRAGFDRDEAKVGRVLAGIPTFDITELKQRVAELGIDIGFITVPPAVAQEVADALADAGVSGILNFAPIVINVPSRVRVEPVDFLAGLKRLAYYIRDSKTPEPVADPR